MPSTSTMQARLISERAATWEKAKALLDTCDTDKRAMSTEEETTWSALNADIDALDARVNELAEVDARNATADEARTRYEASVRSTDTTASDLSDVERDVRAFLAGETRSVNIRPEKRMTMAERRTLSKLSAGAGANTVRTSFYEQLQAHMIEVSGVLLAGPTVLSTTSGESIQIPKTTAHSTAALTAEAAVIAASDPTFGQVTLGAYKYAVLVKVSNELVTDTSVDLLGYLSMEVGRSLGNAAGAHFVTGTGTAQPSGVVTGATLGVTGAASTVGTFTANDLIDLQYSVIAPYRNSPSAGWLMRDATVAKVRKLTDTVGQFIWSPSLVVGAPDILLGKPVHTDPNVAATALSAKSVLFGDFSRYFIREVAGVRFERSDEFAFDSDLVTFRGIWRADGALVDTTGAIKYFQGNAA